MEGLDSPGLICSSCQEPEPLTLQPPAVEVSEVSVFVLVSLGKAGHLFLLPSVCSRPSPGAKLKLKVQWLWELESAHMPGKHLSCS